MSDSSNNPKKNVWLGTLEAGLFMEKSVRLFPDDKKAGLLSFLVPLLLPFFWVYPLAVVPTQRMGDRGYFGLLSIHLPIEILVIAVFFPILWGVTKFLNKTEHFWRTVVMCNFIGIAEFALMVPLLAMVMLGIHSWDEIYAMLIVVMFYQIALTGFVIAYSLNVPWQFAGGLAFMTMFIDQSVSKTVFFLMGIEQGALI